MNLNDFVVTNKPSSVKLKTRNLREMKLETAHLEFESKDMESRLQQLRQSMSREKEEREKSGGYHWKSSQPGTSTTNPQGVGQNKENSFQKLSAGKMKIKVLRDQPEELNKSPEKRPTPTGSLLSRKTKLKGKDCGQCESKKAGVMCKECGEDYCLGCFARFHQKGALKHHRMIPIQMEIQTSISTLDVVSQFKKQIDPEGSTVKTRQEDAVLGKQSPVRYPSPEIKRNAEILVLGHGEQVQNPTPRDGDQSLLKGVFDEEESAQSFQEVLMKWRDCKGDDNQEWSPSEAVPVLTGVSAVQVDLVQVRKTIDVGFKQHSLSYMEKLLLKKHRRTPIEQYQPMTSDALLQRSPIGLNRLIDEECLNLTDEEMEVHRYCTSLFTASEINQHNHRTESCLSVVELDEEIEDHFEESTGGLVQEADTKEIPFCPSMKEPKKTRVASPQQNDSLETTEVEEIKLPEKLERQTQPLTSRKSSTPRKGVSASNGKTSSKTLQLSCCQTDSSKQEGRVYEHPQGPKQRARNRIEKQTASPPVNSHTSAQTASLLQNMSFEDSASTSGNGLSPKHLLESSRTTDHGLTAKPSAALHNLAERKVRDQYHGLNGFLTLGVETKKLGPNPFQPTTSFENEGDEELLSEETIGMVDWRPCSSLSENADEVVVSSVIGSARSRPSSSRCHPINSGRAGSSLKQPPPPVEDKESSPGKKLSKSSRPSTAEARPLSRAALEILQIETIDSMEKDDPRQDDEADDSALANLEEEFKMLRRDEDVDKTNTQDSNAFRTQEWITIQTAKSWDTEGHTDDEEEILRDKQNVMSLP
ncbi:zinc finger B-box domain-containing protein 1 isoform X2 [Amia ocellicauda]|uniref:zinc finger B-box domain-containing protein 1 isoform X2 n=1 Tax=Amia ocellicauda TaxID=2972642 RepID=UPI0034645D31